MEWVERVSRQSIDMYDQGEPDVCIIEVKTYCQMLLNECFNIFQ